MSQYDKQYQGEEDLFGAPYKEFEEFVQAYKVKDGKALDLGCGQGRDALMLAKYGYKVTAVDSSNVGVSQMVEVAKSQKLLVDGVVADFYEYEPLEDFDAIVFDSILHFEKADREKELALLDTALEHLNNAGYLFIFVHKSPKKEKELNHWLEAKKSKLSLVKDGYIDYVYEEKASNFRTAFQLYMLILQRIVTP